MKNFKIVTSNIETKKVTCPECGKEFAHCGDLAFHFSWKHTQSSNEPRIDPREQ